MESIAQNIKRLREFKNISPEQMAEKLDRDVRTYRKIENGENSPTLRDLTIIAETLEMTLLNLIGFRESQVFNNGRFQGNFTDNRFDDIDKFLELHQELERSKDAEIAALKEVVSAQKDEISLMKELHQIKNR